MRQRIGLREYVNLTGAHEDGPNGSHLDIPDSTGFSCTGIDGSGACRRTSEPGFYRVYSPAA